MLVEIEPNAFMFYSRGTGRPIFAIRSVVATGYEWHFEGNTTE